MRGKTSDGGDANGVSSLARAAPRGETRASPKEAADAVRRHHDPRLAALHDTLNAPPRSDRDFYFSLAEGAPLRVLDVGCASGWLATRFAARRHAVSGERVVHETRSRFSGEELTVATDTLRFADRDTLARLLVAAGFEHQCRHGGVDASTVTASSPESIVVASAADDAPGQRS